MKPLNKLIYIALVFFVFAAGCDRCRSSSDGLERAADARVTTLSTALPDTADAAVVVPDLMQMRTSVDFTLERVSHYQPQIRTIEAQIARELGIRITDEQSWKDSGISTDGSLIVAIVGNRPVVATYVDDRQKFESRLIERVRRFAETETPIRSDTIKGQSFKISGDDPAKDIAWFYRDSMVFLAMPPLDALGAYKAGTAISVISGVADVTPENSLGESESFKAFRRGLGDHFPISLYVHAERYFERPATGPQSGIEAALESLVAWSQSNADAAGIGARADEKRLELRAFVSGDEELLAEARKAYTSEADTDWSGMLTERTVLGIRTGFDLSHAVETYLEGLPDAERRQIQRQMVNIGRAYELDMDEDVIGALSGHSLLVFLGIGGDLSRLMGAVSSGSMPDIVRTVLSNAGLLVNLHFTDEEKLDLLLERLEEFGEDHLDRRNLLYKGDEIEDIELFEPRMLNIFPARLFHRGDSITLAAAGIGENAAYEYLTSNREDTLLVDSEKYELGKEFADSDGFNGVYLNFDNLRSNIRRIPMASGFAGTLQPLHELLISGGVDDDGFYMSAVMDFTDPLVVEEDDDEDQ